MTGLLNRPDAQTAYHTGLLRKDQFQVAYVTNDLERACGLFSQRYGIGEYDYIRGDMPEGARIAVALAWSGVTNYEIIEAHGDEAAFYNKRLPADDFAIRFHHLGFLVHDRQAWRALEQELEKGGWPIVSRVEGNGLMDAYYVEAPELGHYLEYIYPLEAGLEFLMKLPEN